MLIGDKKQKDQIISKRFKIFDNFDFNSSIAKCDGFLTASSSSILQAMVLNKNSGIVDLFNNGTFKYLSEHKVISLVKDSNSLTSFLERKSIIYNDEVLRYCGLNKDSKFNLVDHLQHRFEEFHKYR